jgi:hypothetical protein
MPLVGLNFPLPMALPTPLPLLFAAERTPPAGSSGPVRSPLLPAAVMWPLVPTSGGGAGNTGCEAAFLGLHRGHVEALPGQLAMVVGYLTWRPRSAAAALERLAFAWMQKPRAGEVIGAVASTWRAAELRSLPAEAPMPAWLPGRRTGYSAPPGRPCGWYWLEAVAEWYYLGPPLYHRPTAEDGDLWSESDDSGDQWEPPRSRRGPQGRALAVLLARLAELREERWWGLDVRTASDVVTQWMWHECHVLLAIHGRVYRTSNYGGSVELILDMQRYLWLVGPGRERDEIGFLDPLVDWRHLYCYGN